MFGLLLLSPPDLRAQVYSPFWGLYPDVHYQQYLQYQNYLHWQQYLEYLRLNDPYYDLHVLHYQLYLQPYQPYQIYPPCCDAFITPWSSSSYSFGRIPNWYRSQLPEQSDGDKYGSSKRLPA
jgi:hypothetical protein